MLPCLGHINVFTSEDAPFSGHQCRIANPHSNAAVDLNGDCVAGSHLLALEFVTWCLIGSRRYIPRL